jgi:hypothetical protein
MRPSAASAGEEDKSRRRWRLALSILAWSLLVQSVGGLLTAPMAFVSIGSLGLPAGADMSSVAAMPGGGPRVDDAVGRLAGQTRLLAWVGLLFSAASAISSIGLLKRRRWGWFATIGIQLASIVAVFVWFLPVLEDLLRLVAAERAVSSSLSITLLIALVPLSIVGFLMLRGVVRQFAERISEQANP